MASGTVKSEELRGNAPKDETSVKFKVRMLESFMYSILDHHSSTAKWIQSR